MLATRPPEISGEVGAYFQSLAEAKTSILSAELALTDLVRNHDTKLAEALDQKKQVEHELASVRQELTAAQAKIAKLEDKLNTKRDEIEELREQLDRREEKLLRKREAILRLEGMVEKFEAKATASRRRSSGSPEGGDDGHRRPAGASPSHVTDEEPLQRARSERRTVSRSRGRDAANPSEPERQVLLLQGDGDADGEADRRGDHNQGGDELSSQRQRARDGRGRGSSVSPDGERRRSRSRERRSPSRSLGSSRPRTRSGGRHRSGRDRSDSRRRSRSRSRQPWHKGRGKGSSRVSSGKGTKGDRDSVALCIPYIVGKCQWGSKCRERHPSPEDCKAARESLQNKVCRFGANCKRRDCIFKHPDDR